MVFKEKQKELFKLSEHKPDILQDTGKKILGSMPKVRRQSKPGKQIKSISATKAY